MPEINVPELADKIVSLTSASAGTVLRREFVRTSQWVTGNGLNLSCGFFSPAFVKWLKKW